MGRPRIHATEEKAAEAKKQSDKISGQKFNKKLKDDPVLHEKNKAQKRNSQAKRIANMTPEEKEAHNEYQRTKQQESRAKKENKPAKIPSQKDLAITIKPMQLQAACETASEITIQKNTSAEEAKKTIHSTVETRV